MYDEVYTKYRKSGYYSHFHVKRLSRDKAYNNECISPWYWNVECHLNQRSN